MLHQETGRPCRSMIAVAALGPMLAALLLLPPAGLQAAMAAAAQGASVTAPQRATHAAAPVPPSATRAAVPVLPPATRPTAPTTRPASPATAPAARPAEARASGASRATICTQNLWNYGLPKQVRALRYPKESLMKVRAEQAFALLGHRSQRG